MTPDECVRLVEKYRRPDDEAQTLRDIVNDILAGEDVEAEPATLEKEIRASLMR